MAGGDGAVCDHRRRMSAVLGGSRWQAAARLAFLLYYEPRCIGFFVHAPARMLHEIRVISLNCALTRCDIGWCYWLAISNVQREVDWCGARSNRCVTGLVGAG